MKINPLPFFALTLAVLACNLMPAAPDKFTLPQALTLAAQTSQAQSPTSSPGLGLDQALTLAV